MDHISPTDIFSRAARAGSLALVVMPLLVGQVSTAAAGEPAGPALLSLSEIKKESVPEAGEESETPQADDAQPDTTVPMPDPIRRAPLPLPEGLEPGEAEPAAEEPAEPGEDGVTPARPEAASGEPLPEIIYDTERLTVPARRMRELIMEACRSGDIENLRPLIGLGADITQLSLGGIESDPVDFLREISGDDEGQEILAILYEVLDAGFVHLDAGTPEEIYVWPYFFALPLDGLDARQRVELFKIVTAGDYEDMRSYGAYNFYRVGITPEGRWVFFVAGD